MRNKITIIILLGAFITFAQKNSKVQTLPPNEFIKMLNATATKQLLDVRTPGEWASGKIKSSTCIDFNSADFSSKIEVLDKSKPVFMYCASGMRSARAAKVLENKGFTKIYNLSGGGYSTLAQAGIE